MSSTSSKENKKKDKKNMQSQVDNNKTSSVSSEQQSSEAPTAFLTKDQKRWYCYGFAGIGLLMGFLWGANSIIDVGQSASPLIQAAKASVAVATTSADISKGAYYGLVGALIGVSFGYSISLDSKPMLASLIFGCLGLWLGISIGGPALAGVGWLIGYGAVIMNAIGLERYRQVYVQVAKERSAQKS